MTRKLLSFVLVFAFYIIPVTNLSASPISSSEKSGTAKLLENVQLNNSSSNQISFNFTESNSVASSSKLMLGTVNFTRFKDSSGLVQIQTKSGKSLDIYLKPKTNGKISLELVIDKTVAKTEFSDVKQISKSYSINKLVKKVALDNELTSLLMKSGKLFGTKSIPDTIYVDDDCATRVFFCILAIVGEGLALGGLIACPETAGLGCALSAIAAVTVGGMGMGDTCGAVTPACADKTSAETGVYADGGNIFIAWEPIIIDVPEDPNQM